MSFNFQFRFAEDRKEIDQLAKFLLLQPLNYPDYGDWVERARTDLLSGYKNSILAFSDGFLVGDVVYQSHKQFPRIRELKNLRVHPKLRGRYFGMFMFRQAEKENLGDFDAVICDTRSDRIEVLNMTRLSGYQELLRAPIYDKNVEDVVMYKSFERTSSGLLGPIKRDLLARAA
ncbi:hypothetical protein HY212_04570 [Candidatus Pacearchaeota archaeon]|nr:hypothetical protein [Candidatus Pacearchaeota archaeon]